MDKYIVRMTDRAVADLENIYNYISAMLLEPEVAKCLIDQITEKILTLETMPYRCPERRVGAYARAGYRQLLVKNYSVIYRVDESQKVVLIVTIKYSTRNF